MNKIIIKLLIPILSPLVLFSQPFTSKSQWETYFKNKILELDPIEGIWTNSNTMKFYNSYNKLIYSNYNPQVQSVVIYDNGYEYKVL
jgi:hypothetical protein